MTLLRAYRQHVSLRLHPPILPYRSLLPLPACDRGVEVQQVPRERHLDDLLNAKSQRRIKCTQVTYRVCKKPRLRGYESHEELLEDQVWDRQM